MRSSRMCECDITRYRVVLVRAVEEAVAMVDMMVAEGDMMV